MDSLYIKRPFEYRKCKIQPEERVPVSSGALVCYTVGISNRRTKLFSFQLRVKVLSRVNSNRILEAKAAAPETGPDADQKEQKFMDAAKAYWQKTFGAMEFPPPINSSLNQPPLEKVMEALSAVGKREDSKNAGQHTKLDARDEATMVKEFQATAAAGGKLNPNLVDAIAKKLAGMFSGPDGPDPQTQTRMKELLKSLASGPATNAAGAGGQMKIDVQGQERFKEEMNAAMSGNPDSELRKLQKGELGAIMKAMGYGGDHSTSTVLAVSKCYGPPEVDNVVHDKSVEMLFFAAQELSPGQKFKLQFAQSTNNGAFMECIEEDRAGILGTVLLMDVVTVVAKAIDKQPADPDITAEMDTIIMCDQPAVKGKNKEKTCAMDLETMVNYTTAKLGKDIRPAATWLTKWQSAGPVDYTVESIRKLPALSTVGCCKMGFPFAVFYCQPFPKAVNYVLALAGSDGSSLKAPVICHEDTSTWNLKSWLFETLKTKPGASKICHFLAADDVAWMPKTQENAAS